MVDFTDNDDDIFTGKEHTPIRENAFEKSPQEKIEKITELFGEIMETLGSRYDRRFFERFSKTCC